MSRFVLKRRLRRAEERRTSMSVSRLEHPVRLRAASASASLLLGVALVATPVAAALADAPAGHGHGSKAAHAAKEKATSKARRAEHALGSHRSVVVGGVLVSVAPAVAPADGSTAATPGSLVLLVHGHKFKALRGTELTVAVSPVARVTRDGAAELADLVAGDHVVVRLTGLDLSVVRGASGGWEITGTATAVRVAASPAEGTADETSGTDTDTENGTAPTPSS
jgi:hypothetical protein